VKRDLTLIPLFEVLHALAELVVLPSEVLERYAEQRLGFVEAFVNMGLVLSISPFHEGREPLGHKPDLVTKIFDQHAAMALDLFDPLIYLIEAAINPIEVAVNPFEAAINPFESPIDLLESPVDPLESPVDLLEPPVVPV